MGSKADFRIFAICVTKNENDVIAHSLREASRWADRIFVYDNGSTDGTWETAQRLADKQIVPWRQDAKPFQEGLRAEVFNAFRGESRPGDWWCRLDSDEFYLQNPRQFLAGVAWPCHTVWGLSIDFYLTSDDLERLNFDEPVENILPQLRHYSSKHSETRFFRDRRRLTWSEQHAWPAHVGLSWPEQIRLRHYKYRSPRQIQARLDTRHEAIKRGFPGWWAQCPTEWRQQICKAEDLRLDTGDGRYLSDPQALTLHLESKPRRLVKRILHGTGIWP